MTTTTACRTDELLEVERDALHRRTDRLFEHLMVFQWLAGIVLAVTVSPRTWAGAEGTVHLHVWLAVLFGTILSLPPILMARFRPGAVVTRHFIGVSQAMWSALLIHLTGGRIETHFHVFGSLAFLAFYRDWKVLVSASAVIAADHFVRGIWWPQSVFGVLATSQWRWVEHAAWVVFEDFFLIGACLRGSGEMRRIASRRAELEDTNERIEEIVATRTAELERAHADYRRQTVQEHSLIDAMPSLLVRVDAGGRVTTWNPAAEGFLGLRAEDVLGRPFASLRLPFDAAHAASLLSDCAGTREYADVPYRRAGGDEGFLEFLAATIPDGVLLIGIDVTERKAMIERIDSSQRLESIGQLAAGIAHEINTPIQYIGDNVRFLEDSFGELMAILALAGDERPMRDESWMDRFDGAVEAADVEFVGAEIPKAIEQTLEGIARVAEIVKAMKEFSHPGVDEMKPMDLNRAIHSTITVARNEWKYVAEVETDLEEGLAPVSCLPGEVTQVVLNMIVNAAHAIADVVGDASGEKGVIKIATRTDGDHVKITITDTGKGIPPEIQKKVFEPFFTTKEVGKGTGQGLAITHSVIVKKHRGTIGLESKVGVGTTFTIRLPFEQMSAEELVEGAA